MPCQKAIFPKNVTAFTARDRFKSYKTEVFRDAFKTRQLSYKCLQPELVESKSTTL
jgi:hypothetical protein